MTVPLWLTRTTCSSLSPSSVNYYHKNIYPKTKMEHHHELCDKKRIIHIRKSAPSYSITWQWKSNHKDCCQTVLRRKLKIGQQNSHKTSYIDKWTKCNIFESVSLYGDTLYPIKPTLFKGDARKELKGTRFPKPLSDTNNSHGPLRLLALWKYLWKM